MELNNALIVVHIHIRWNKSSGNKYGNYKHEEKTNSLASLILPDYHILTIATIISQ